MRKVIYCGPYYDSRKEVKIIQLAKGRLNNAPNRFQKALLNGLSELLESDQLVIINTLPIGTWPKHSKKLLLPNRAWSYGHHAGFEIGNINLPLIKQKDRTFRIYRQLKKIVQAGDCILLYSCYLPFINAICRLKQDFHFSMIVTDLPEFYDLGYSTRLKQFFRKLNNRAVYRKLSRVDSFVLLTEQMKEPLRVGSRPYTIVEGIWTETGSELETETENSEKKIVLYTGTLHYQFGIQLLLDAFEQIKDPNFELWICGAGEAAKDIKALSKTDQRVVFFGFCDSCRVAELRSKATVLVNPRTPDGEYTKYSFPSKTMEYLGSGKPVVMFKLPGIPAEYDDYLFYIKEAQAESLAEKLIEACSLSKEERAAYAKKAKEFIRTKKSGAVQAAKILRLMGIKGA